MVALVRASEANPKDGQFCGGLLIDAKWVLTAARCDFDDVFKILVEPGQVCRDRGCCRRCGGGQTSRDEMHCRDYHQSRACVNWRRPDRRRTGCSVAGCVQSLIGGGRRVIPVARLYSLSVGRRITKQRKRRKARNVFVPFASLVYIEPIVDT